MELNPIALTVYKSPFPKIRIGNIGDGGYVIADVPNIRYNLLLAGGVCEDISFEDALMKRYPGMKCLAFDSTVSSLPTHDSQITFIQKNIGGHNDATTTNLHDTINANDHIFVKMDIEGGEKPWVASLSDAHLDKFEQIVMEFHWAFDWDAPGMYANLNKTHRLIHVHPNNCCGVRTHKGVVIPNVWEGTYLHKKYFGNVLSLNTDPIPSALDVRNMPQNPEIHIDHPPFVNKAVFNLPIVRFSRRVV
jgi:hypothetical protein